MKLPKGKIRTLEFSGRSALSLPLLADKTPAREFTIFRAGVNDSDYGPVTFDEIAAAFVMQNQADKGNALKFDYNHGMALKYATAEQGKSAGDFEIEVRDGALWAINCQWTPEAYDRISKGEYGLFSPWFDVFDSDDGVRRPFRLYNVAILNCAGLNDIDSIAAGAAPIATKETDMNEAEIQAMKDRNAALERENTVLRAQAGELISISGSLQLGAAAGPTERATAFHGLLELRSEVRKITGKETDAAAIGELHNIVARAGEATALKTSAEAAEQAALQVQLDHVFEMGASAGSLAATPAARTAFEAGALVSMKKLNGGKLSPEIIAIAKDRVEMSAKVSTAGGGSKAPTVGSSGTGGTAIDSALLAAASIQVQPKFVEAAFARQQQRRSAGG